MFRLSKYLPNELPLGKILGKVTLVKCIKCDDEFKKMCMEENKEIYAKSTFNEEYAWKMNNVETFEKYIEINGKLGLWNYDI